MSAHRGRITLIAAPILLALALGAWAFSSPVGSAPDDDFHLVSIWCADNSDQTHCIHEAGSASAIVPEGVARAACFKFYPERSAQCQENLDFTAPPNTETTRGNFVGGYPPLYYSVMNWFVGDDVVTSVLLMRLMNIFLFVALATGVYLLLPASRRPILTWSWAITTVPLGLFVIASTNPSAWAITGVGLGWIALAGYFESSGPRKIGLAALFALLAVMAAGSRGDAAVFMVIAIAAVIVLTFQRSRRYLLDAILPVVVATVCILMFRLSRPIDVATQGLNQPGGSDGGSGSGGTPSSGFAGVAYNLLEVPSIWTGIWGNGWGLGWLDTSMPAVVWLGALLAFTTIGATVVRRPGWRKIVVLTGGILLLWLLPTAVLVAAGDTVGENVQPRYLLPLIILFAGVLLWPSQVRTVSVPRLHYLLVAAVLTAAAAIALFLNTARYVSGFDDLSWNLNADIEWWWGAGLSPMAVWMAGAIAYGVAAFVLLRERTIPFETPESEAQPAVDHAVPSHD